MITKELLNEIFEYKDGHLYWKKKYCHKINLGQIAGSEKKRYWQTNIFGKRYYNHRLIYIMHYGEIKNHIDHIDGNGKNNKIENLRDVTRAQNMWNSIKPKNNNSGTKGISFLPRLKKWRARIKFNKKEFHIGVFEKKEDAIQKLNEFRAKYHGEFARA